MHSTVAYTAQTPSQTARSQSARSAVWRTAVRKANREAVAVLGGKSMILVCIFTPLKIVGFIGSTPRGGGKLQKERSREPESRSQERHPWSAASLHPSLKLWRTSARPTGREP